MGNGRFSTSLAKVGKLWAAEGSVGYLARPKRYISYYKRSLLVSVLCLENKHIKYQGKKVLQYNERTSFFRYLRDPRA